MTGVRDQTPARTLQEASADDLALLDGWWRAANYLAVGQIYLKDNPLLHEPLRPEHLKPRVLGHWGTTPGLTFLWATAGPPCRTSPTKTWPGRNES